MTPHIHIIRQDLVADQDCGSHPSFNFAHDIVDDPEDQGPIHLLIYSRRMDSFGASFVLNFIRVYRDRLKVIQVAQPRVLHLMQILGIDQIVPVEPLLPVSAD